MLSNMTEQELWMATVKGNKVVSYHSEVADAQDQYRVGVSISRHAGIILEAMKELKSDNIRKLVKDDILKGVLAEANQLQPQLQPGAISACM